MSQPHRSNTVIKRAAEVTATGDVVWDPADGRIFVILDVTFTPSANCTFTLFDNTDGNDAGTLPLRVFKGEILADTPVTLQFQSGWPSTTRNNRLLATTTTGTVYVQVVGYEAEG